MYPLMDLLHKLLHNLHRDRLELFRVSDHALCEGEDRLDTVHHLIRPPEDHRERHTEKYETD